MKLSLREIDRELAIRVMGITSILECPAYREPECGTWAIWFPEMGEWYEKGYSERILTYRPDPESDWREELPHYTTDPLASKQVREKLAEKWPVVNLRWDADYGRGGKPFECCVESSDFDGDRGEMFRGIAKTEELCVALCALKSVWFEDIEVQL